MNRLLYICKQEGVAAEKAALAELVEATNGDIRQCLNKLQMVVSTAVSSDKSNDKSSNKSSNKGSDKSSDKSSDKGSDKGSNKGSDKSNDKSSDTPSRLSTETVKALLPSFAQDTVSSLDRLERSCWTRPASRWRSSCWWARASSPSHSGTLCSSTTIPSRRW